MHSVFPVLLAYSMVARQRQADPEPGRPRRTPRRARAVPSGWRPLPDEDAWLLPDGRKVTGLDLAEL